MSDNPLLISNTDISGILKNVYESFRINAFPLTTPLLAQLKKGAPGGPERMQWSGNGVFWDVMLTRPTGMTSSTAGNFPPTAAVREQQASVGIKRTYVTRQVDRLALSGTSSKEGAFASIGRKVYTEAVDATRLGMQEVLHGDGRGIKGIVSSVTSTTIVVVDSPYGIASSGAGGLLLDKDMYICIKDTTGATERGKATITGVANSGDSATVTYSPAIAGVQSTDILVACTIADDSFGDMPNGLLNLLNYGGSFNNLHGINNATAGNARWNTTRLTPNDPAQPNEMDIWDLATKVAGKSGKDAKMRPGEFLMMSTPGIEKKLAESFLGQRRWDASVNPTLKGGYKAVQICGINLVTDTFCPAGLLYLTHIPSLSWVDREDWQKVKWEDSGSWRPIQGRDAFEFTLGSYWNTAVLQRNAHGMYTGYTDTVRYSHEM